MCGWQRDYCQCNAHRTIVSPSFLPNTYSLCHNKPKVAAVTLSMLKKYTNSRLYPYPTSRKSGSHFCFNELTRSVMSRFVELHRPSEHHSLKFWQKSPYFVRFTLKAVARQKLVPALALDCKEVALCVHWLNEVLMASDMVTSKKCSQAWKTISLKALR